MGLEFRLGLWLVVIKGHVEYNVVPMYVFFAHHTAILCKLRTFQRLEI